MDTDTFCFLGNDSGKHRYLIEGTIRSDLVTISLQNSDTTKYVLHQSFKDTLIINKANKKDAEKMACHIVQVVLHDDKHELIISEERKRAKR